MTANRNFIRFGQILLVIFLLQNMFNYITDSFFGEHFESINALYRFEKKSGLYSKYVWEKMLFVL